MEAYCAVWRPSWASWSDLSATRGSLGASGGLLGALLAHLGALLESPGPPGCVDELVPPPPPGPPPLIGFWIPRDGERGRGTAKCLTRLFTPGKRGSADFQVPKLYLECLLWPRGSGDRGVAFSCGALKSSLRGPRGVGSFVRDGCCKAWRYVFLYISWLCCFCGSSLVRMS